MNLDTTIRLAAIRRDELLAVAASPRRRGARRRRPARHTEGTRSR